MGLLSFPTAERVADAGGGWAGAVDTARGACCSGRDRALSGFRPGPESASEHPTSAAASAADTTARNQRDVTIVAPALPDGSPPQKAYRAAPATATAADTAPCPKATPAAILTRVKLATWNVNSVRARLERLLGWLAKHRPDVLCLQEIKCTDDAFPAEALAAAGYHAAVFGQKTYNGVAILAKEEPRSVRRGLTDDDADARLISADVVGVRILSAYVPNGREVGSESYAYKLDWLARLREYLERHGSPSQPLVLCGDLNVAIDDKDVAHPEAWADTVLCHPAAREALAHVRDWGLVDVVRKHHPDGGVYSWWDYRQLAFPRNDGLRLDHVYATAPLAGRSTVASVDRDERKGAKPSDHAPVIADFAD